MKPLWLHFQHQRLASNMSLTMDKIPQFGSMSVMKVSSARSIRAALKKMLSSSLLAGLQIKATSLKYFEQKNSDQQKTWKHTSINVLFAGGRRHFCSSEVINRFKSAFLKTPRSKPAKYLDEIFIDWERMKREQAQNTIPSLAKKFVAIFEFRSLLVTFRFHFRLKIASFKP